MSVMIRRSIGLSQSTADAWRVVGGWFPLRTRNTNSCLSLLRDRESSNKPIINLGDTTFNITPDDRGEFGFTGIIYNNGDDIRCLVQPGRTRERLNEFMPLDPRTNVGVALALHGDTWIKAPGQGGQGKTRIETAVAVTTSIPTAWDMQVHVEGQEYRVITVDLKVVQVSKRFGENDNRSYQWIGVNAAPVSVKEIAREGARRIDGHTIIGWDIIQSGRHTYILEGNTSPGLNAASAARIMKEVLGESYD